MKFSNGLRLSLAVVCVGFSVCSAGVFAAPKPAEADDEIEAMLRQAAADDASNAVPNSAGDTPAAKPSGVRGFSQLELARTIDAPKHWSKILGRVEFGTNGKTEGGIKWKLSARADYDAVFLANNFYNDEVRRDQQFNFSLRENYFDVSAGDWDIRLGRQHVIWGEVVGLFFADVVSARDMREFILPEFNLLRIPQWAARAEYFRDDFHGELLWIPKPTFDETGKPGSEFFPSQPSVPGLGIRYLNEDKPGSRLRNANYGARGSILTQGWDLSAFYYRSLDASATFYRQITPAALVYQARHDRISQVGGTLAKDYGDFVLKGETVYTRGRSQTVLRATDPDGVVPQNTVDWVASIDVPFPSDIRLNLQAFQSIITNHDPDVIPKERESGYSVLLNGKLTPSIEAEIMWVASLDRTDWMLRPKINWTLDRNWRLTVGADSFHGPATGFFGRYSAQDRMYSELRLSF